MCPRCETEQARSNDATQRRSFQDRPAVPLAFPPGFTFARRYTIVEQVGIGGMGQVYKARDEDLGRTVALKMLRPDVASETISVERFRRELSFAGKVSHPNVCRVHDMGSIDESRFISMEYVDGQTLGDVIHSIGRLSPRQTVVLARQICSALKAIHEHSIVHRDLKPSNIMLDRSGRAVVMDFGLALHHDADKITSEGEILGTLAYLSPEQAQTQNVRREIRYLCPRSHHFRDAHRQEGSG